MPGIKIAGRNINNLRYADAAAAAAATAAKSLQSCSTLCDPIDGSPLSSPIPGILQARTLEWVAISFSNAWKWKVKRKSLSRVWLFSDPMDCSPPGSSTHGIFQARALQWGAIATLACTKTFHLSAIPFLPCIEIAALVWVQVCYQKDIP